MEATQRAILDSANLSIISTDLAGTIRTFNRGAERSLGYSAAEVVGRATPALIHDPGEVAEQARLLSQELGRPIEAGFEVFVARVRAGAPDEHEWTYIRKDGSRFPVLLSVTAITDAVGAITGFLGIASDLTERKKAQAELRASELHYRAVFDAAVDGMISIDETGRIEMVNYAAERLFGYRAADLIGRNVSLLMPEPYHSEHDGYLARYLATGTAKIIGIGREVVGLRKDGSTFPLDLAVSEIPSDGRRLFTGILRDISARKASEAALSESAARVRTLLDSTAEAIYGIDLAGNCTFANQSCLRILGYESADQLLGKNMHALIHHTHADGSPYPAEECPIFDAFRRNKEVHVDCEILWRADGTSFPAEYWSYPTRHDDGTATGSVVTFIDVTERRNTEARIRDQAQLLDLANSGILVLDLEDRLVYWNDGAQRLYGFARQEALGRVSHELLQTESPCPLPEIHEIVAREGRWEGVLSHRRRDGTRIVVASRWAMKRDEAGRPVSTLELNTDITKQVRLEEELRRKNLELEEQTRQAQTANRLKSEFLANMSHELRTPLNGIIGFAHLLHEAEVGPVSAEQKDFLGDILRSARHLLQLINDILDLSKVEAGKMEFRLEPVQPAKIVSEVRDIVRSLAAAKRIRVETEIDPNLGPIMADPARLKQILYNYLSNALKFTPEEGRVTIAIGPEPGDAYRVEVEDTGVGIAAEDLARLFVDFSQLDAGATKRHQGTGLGLALTKRIVEAQGGHVGVRSTPGQGSIFFAVLPLVPNRTAATAPAVVPATNSSPTPLPGRSVATGEEAPTILVVEDDPKESAWLRRVLGEAGYACVFATTGAEAIAQAQERPFAAITLDLFLPDMTGWDVLRAIRLRGPNRESPVIVVTVVADRGTAVGFKIQDFLTKPARSEDLLVALTRAGVTPGGSRPILVVEDDPGAAKLAASALEAQGFRPILAPEGESGLRAAAEEHPAVVILDLAMPGMDGFEFLRRFRRTAEGARTPVIVWSAKDLTGDERVGLQAAAQAVVLKGAGAASALVDELNLQVREVAWRANPS